MRINLTVGSSFSMEWAVEMPAQDAPMMTMVVFVVMLIVCGAS